MQFKKTIFVTLIAISTMGSWGHTQENPDRTFSQIIGSVLGGVIGYQFGQGTGKAVGAAVGAVTGAAVGGAIYDANNPQIVQQCLNGYSNCTYRGTEVVNGEQVRVKLEQKATTLASDSRVRCVCLNGLRTYADGSQQIVNYGCELVETHRHIDYAQTYLSQTELNRIEESTQRILGGQQRGTGNGNASLRNGIDISQLNSNQQSALDRAYGTTRTNNLQQQTSSGFSVQGRRTGAGNCAPSGNEGKYPFIFVDYYCRYYISNASQNEAQNECKKANSGSDRNCIMID